MSNDIGTRKQQDMQIRLQEDRPCRTGPVEYSGSDAGVSTVAAISEQQRYRESGASVCQRQATDESPKVRAGDASDHGMILGYIKYDILTGMINRVFIEAKIECKR